MRKPLLFVLSFALLLIAILPAEAAPTGTTPSGRTATFRGRPIDLSRGWGAARACAVLTEKDIRCYASEAEQWRDLGGRVRQPLVQEADVFCLNRSDLAVVLYSNTNYGGTSLSLFVADIWHDLAALGFDNVTSSWKNNTYCDATAATGAGGSGSTLTLTARSQNSDVGSTWNDVISSVRISS